MDQGGGVDQDARQRAAEIFQCLQRRGHGPDEAQGVLLRVNLRHNLTAEQQQEGQENRFQDKSEERGLGKINPGVYAVGAEHDDSHIDEVVRDQDRSQEVLGTFQELPNQRINGAILLLYLVEISGRQREESHFGSGHETRYNQQQKSQGKGKNNAC